ncbi:MAG: ATP synthase F1 subunit gamma [Leptolinea sp.]|jgi:F-type H+-transporting ATPase subunit gamma|nr:ATP synthase F1 subunit gamma [Leptolinea sp.]
MASAREMRLRIRSVKSIAQVTRALETVSAAKVRRAIAAVNATRPYAEKSWKLLVHLARQPGHTSLHPLLQERVEVKKILVILVSGDRGLAGAFNANIVKDTLDHFRSSPAPVSFIAVGRKGRDMLMRRRREVIAEFSDLPIAPTFASLSAVGHLVIDEYLQGKVDQVFLAYTDFHSMVKQDTVIRKLLPLEVQYADDRVVAYNVTHHSSNAVFIYEPDDTRILDGIITRFTELQVYQAILTSQASEQAARMVSMRNATDNANELITSLQLDYNKARQQSITNDMLDITGGAEAMTAMMKNLE